MKVDLDEFMDATRRLHAASVKRTRLMLKLRPQSRAEHRHRIFVLKVTDGNAVYTTSVRSLAEVKKVEGLVNDFVTRCTKDACPPAAAQTASASGPEKSSQPSHPQDGKPNSSKHQEKQPHASNQGGKNGSHNNNPNNSNKGGKGGKKGRK